VEKLLPKKVESREEEIAGGANAALPSAAARQHTDGNNLAPEAERTPRWGMLEYISLLFTDPPC
jgi:hypothetical protein